MICNQCGYSEDGEYDEKFIGIFANGISFSTTEGETCAIYGCPKCKAVQFTTDIYYIRKRKAEYKDRMKR